jgi:hypothetical protein
MRTKTLALTAVVAAVGIASAAAQTVYSVNAVGYVNKTVPANGFALLANPLNLATNTLATVLPDVPANTVVWKWNGTFAKYTMRTSGWGTAGTTPVAPGEGFFVQNVAATPLVITFVGEVLTGTQTTPINPGFNILGSKIPQAGKIETELGLPVKQNDVVYKFAGTYSTTTRRTDATPWGTGGVNEPIIEVGEGFFLLSKSTVATSWARTFTIPQ